MTSHHSRRKSKILLGSALLFLLLLLIGLFFFFSPSSELPGEPAEDPSFAPFISSPPSPPPPASPASRASSTLSDSPKPPFPENPSSPPEEALPKETIPEETLPGEAPSNKIETPSNFAPVEWMAPVEDVDLHRLEADLLEGELRQAFELARRADRRTSMNFVDAAVQPCIDDVQRRLPDLQGRIALQWRLQTSAGQGELSQAAILLNHGLRDPLLEDCLVDAVDDLSFQAEGDGADLLVEHILTVRRP